MTTTLLPPAPPKGPTKGYGSGGGSEEPDDEAPRVPWVRIILVVGASLILCMLVTIALV